jgi:predicted nuclease of restriction endonuclease-like (RecB) superfamily
MLQKQFSDIIELIKQSRAAAIKAVNTELITLYWNIGEHISKRVESAEWGQSVVQELADYIQQNEPDLKGFSDKNLWRMKQFYEAYKDAPNLSPLVREIHPNIINSFKDSYVFEFLNLPEPHNENDVQKGLIRQMTKMILELGKDFLFIGEEYKVQVGNRDFKIDLLF